MVAHIACGAPRSPAEQKLALIVLKAVSQKDHIKVTWRSLKLHCLDFECLTQKCVCVVFSSALFIMIICSTIKY